MTGIDQSPVLYLLIEVPGDRAGGYSWKVLERSGKVLINREAKTAF
jgi:hypothetical protein